MIDVRGVCLRDRPDLEIIIASGVIICDVMPSPEGGGGTRAGLFAFGGAYWPLRAKGGGDVLRRQQRLPTTSRQRTPRLLLSISGAPAGETTPPYPRRGGGGALDEPPRKAVRISAHCHCLGQLGPSTALCCGFAVPCRAVQGYATAAQCRATKVGQ